MRQLLVLMGGVALAACAGAPAAPSTPGTDAPASAAVAPDSVAVERTRFVEEVRAQIAGREHLPAAEVFRNIQLLERMPAGRLLAVMDVGFGRSLGVSCTHCHDPEDWADDGKPEKGVARSMWGMVSTVNRELLANIPDLKSESPAVNCTTCHRGETKPALDMRRGR